MTTILIVEKSGSIKESTMKTVVLNELYKKAGYKTNDDFKFIHRWNVSLETTKYNISLFGKTTGKANTENKYDFPPPVDTELLFGNCILINSTDNNEFISLTTNEWEKIYEFLFGGFEDLDEEKEEDTEEEEDTGDLPVTKTGGYLKDGFVVDDDEEDEEEEESEEESEEEIVVRKPKPKSRGTLIKKTPPEDEIETFFDCQSELSEESYLYTLEDLKPHKNAQK
jgi:hypothetical protein